MVNILGILELVISGNRGSQALHVSINVLGLRYKEHTLTVNEVTRIYGEYSEMVQGQL